MMIVELNIERIKTLNKHFLKYNSFIASWPATVTVNITF